MKWNSPQHIGVYLSKNSLNMMDEFTKTSQKLRPTQTWGIYKID